MVAFAGPMVRICLPPAASPCLTQTRPLQVENRGFRAGVRRSAGGACRQRRAGRSSMALKNSNVSVGPYSSTAMLPATEPVRRAGAMQLPPGKPQFVRRPIAQAGNLAVHLGDVRPTRPIVPIAASVATRVSGARPQAGHRRQRGGTRALDLSPLCRTRLGIPQRLINDWRVFARMGLSLVTDLAAVGAVPQHQVERPAREWLAADHPTRGTLPRLALASLGFELFLQQPRAR